MATSEQSLQEQQIGVKRRSRFLRWDNIPLGFVFIWFGILLIVPLLLIVVISFWPTESHRAIPGFIFDNYAKLIGTGTYVSVLFKTLWMSLLTSIICIAMAYPFAYYVSKKVRKQKLLVLSLVIIPFWTSFLLRAYAGMMILGRQGFINSTLMELGIIKQPMEFLLYSNFAMALGFIYIFVPFAILTLFATMEGINNSVLDAAFDLGASWWQRLRYVTFPLSLPGIFAGFLLVFMPIMGDYVVPSLLGGPQGTMLATLMVKQFGLSAQWGFGSVLGLVLMLLTIVIVGIAGKFVNLGRLFG
jgi:spermidine/putrescine transport system permease protein